MAKEEAERVEPRGKQVEHSRFVSEILLPCGHGVVPFLDSRFMHFALRPDESPIDRWGVFAAEKIPSRRVVMEYTGEWVNPEQSEYRLLRQRNYIYEWSEEWSIDGAIGGSGAQFVNHSCQPNLRFRVWQRRVFLVSKREIFAGEELTLNYHLPNSSEPIPCRCGALLCCGVMNTGPEA